MNKRQFLLVLAMAFLGGIIGGALSNQYFNNLAYSKNAIKEPGKDTIDAKMFRVINEEGDVSCTLGFKDGSASLEFPGRGDFPSTSRIDHDGFESFVKDKRVGMIKTNICPFGLLYYYYPQWEIEAKEKKGPLFNLFAPDDSLIRIGGPNKDGPSIIIRDKYPGNTVPRDRAVLGKVDLIGKNEERISRPASSLVLFSERGNVIFKAP